MAALQSTLTTDDLAIFDPTLNGRAVPYLALADDYTILSTNARALRLRLLRLVRALAQHDLELNLTKCRILLLGHVPSTPPVIESMGHQLEAVLSAKVNGFVVSLSDKGLWVSDVTASTQLSQARKMLRTIKTLRGDLGATCPKRLLHLYRALVESQLNYGAEIGFDMSAPMAYQLNLFQRLFLRFAFGLHCKAMTVQLYRDSTLLMLSHRPLLLATQYLVYALVRARPNRPVHWAMVEALNSPEVGSGP